jgi:putative (di)nucleoside polyphosphate hydrolase
MLLSRLGQVLVARRIDMPSEAWQMPQGGIEEGETPLQAAFRELKEEIGTAKAELMAEADDWLDYDLPADLVGMLWGGQYRGQTQKWFVMRFTGDDSDINIETETPEFLEWKWAEVSALPDLIVPFKRHLYAELVDRFGHLVKPST